MLTAFRQILDQNHQLQQLTPEEGPTALAFHYVQLKTLIKEFIYSNPTQDSYILAWSMLENQSRTQLSTIIDQYAQMPTRRQVKLSMKLYTDAFRELQRHILSAVLMLT